MPLTVNSEVAIPGRLQEVPDARTEMGSRARSVRDCALGGPTIRIVLVVR
jgi:hypothetical protein